MRSRLFFVVVTVFFVTMNVLLWRSEFRGQDHLGHLPVETVWRKILLAPDSSHLEIRHHGKKIGYGTWETRVGEDPVASKRLLEEAPPEGMIREPSGYSIDFGGNFAVDNQTRLRFSFDLRLTTNHQWQEMILHLSKRGGLDQDVVEKPPAGGQMLPWLLDPPEDSLLKLALFSRLEMVASAAAGTMKFSAEHKTGRAEQTIKMADLQHPEILFQQAGLPLSPALMAAFGLWGGSAGSTPSGVTLEWEAHNDWLKIATERMRVYRLQTQLLGFQMILFISLEGEILRVELPDEILLINDQLSNL